MEYIQGQTSGFGILEAINYIKNTKTNLLRNDLAPSLLIDKQVNMCY